jgi:hypothetical protein
LSFSGLFKNRCGEAQDKLKADAYFYTRGFELVAATKPERDFQQPASG